MRSKLITLFILVLLTLSSCGSVVKYNTQIAKKHTPNELKKDIDYAYKKLKKLHPDLYLYTNKDSLDSYFNSLKSSIHKPLSSIEFYKSFAPIIAQIKQGHTTLSPPYKKQTKKEKKEKGKKHNPFKSLRFATLNNNIYIDKNFGIDSTIIVGSQLLKIDNESVNNLTKSFKNIVTGDGYNKTFTPIAIRKYIGSLFIKTHGLKDSIAITLKKNDSIYTKYIYAIAKKVKQIRKDTIVKKKRTKTEKKLAKKKLKSKKEFNFKYGYNNLTKEYTRNLKIIKQDSSSSIAYIKIRGFSNGGFKEFYKESFAKIDSTKSENLIIDLRNNGGGRLNEIAYLYSFLTDKDFIFINKSKMTKSFAWYYPFMHNKSVLIKSASFLLLPVAKIVQLFKVKNINGVPHFKFGSAKLKKPSAINNFKGNVYVLINETSFSASSILANNLKANGAFLVGNETGGANNSTVAGIFVPFELPNSKLKLRFGVTIIDTPHKDQPDGYGVIPNKFIKPTTLDNDEQLDWIINDILKKDAK